MNDRRSVLTMFLVVLSIVVMLSPLTQSFPPIVLADHPPDAWNDAFRHCQQIQLNIKTDTQSARFQPIDMNIQFNELCWGINETVHSIRVCCWNGSKWKELESQIYNIDFSDQQYITSCNIIFLIPSYANGKEQYFIYYDESETLPPLYPDHVVIKDEYYYYEPISGISVEGDYYEIIDDDEIVYGVGQKGKVMNRRLSQIAIRMKPGTTEFDILNSDLLASFCFSYQSGPEDDDEIASDYTLIGKEVTIDGPLMTEFIIISESEDKDIRSSNIYRYYHCPLPNKRITVHVTHDISEDLLVKDMKDNDGRYGGIISYYSKSDSMKKMRFGDILPYIHVYNEKDRVNEYRVNDNPESSKREWVISIDDNCDVGSAAWLSYSEGSKGKTHGLIFSSHDQIVSNVTGERDGIQVRVAVKEYLDLVGAEIDYASISFGRNSYELGQEHDLLIDKGMHVEFDCEFISFQEATYEDVHEESGFFQNLVLFRDVSTNESLGEQYIHTLTVVPHLSGRLFSFPLLENRSRWSLPILYGELYRDNILESSTYVEKSLFGTQLLKFPKLRSGEYVIHLYRVFGNQSRFIGIGHCNLSNDMSVHVYGTWETSFTVEISDQQGNPLSVDLELLQGPLVVYTEAVDQGMHTVSVPFPLFDSYEQVEGQPGSLSDLFNAMPPYFMRAWFKGFKIYNESIALFPRSIDMTLPVYDVVLSITDELDIPPDVNVNPFLTSDEMQIPFEIYPDKQGGGNYYFYNIPEAVYEAHISYAGYMKSKTIHIPSDGDQVDMRFSYMTDLFVELLTIRGESFEDDQLRIELKRLGKIIYDDITDEIPIKVPPGRYTVNVYDDKELIGSQRSQVSHDTVVSVVTTKSSMVQIFFVLSAFILLGTAFVLLFLQYITLNMFLKLIVLGIVFFSLVQPWWSFSGNNIDGSIGKDSDMYLFPQIMIEQYHEDNTRKLSIATIPEVFLDFLFTLSVIIGFGMVLMFLSFIPNILLKKRFAFLLAVISIVFVFIVVFSFYIGMSSITEISLGSIQGEGMIDVSIPSGEKVYMDASWGLGVGFYTILIAASISLGAGIYDIFKSQRERLSKLLHSSRSKK